MVSQTVKYAKARAVKDPDREDGTEGRNGVGVYYGANIAYRMLWALSLTEFTSAVSRQRATRGVCH